MKRQCLNDQLEVIEVMKETGKVSMSPRVCVEMVEVGGKIGFHVMREQCRRAVDSGRMLAQR